MESHNHKLPYDPVIVKVLLAQQYEAQKEMLRTQILMKTAELQLSRQKEQAVILQKSILLNRKAQFEPGHQKYLAIEKQMDAEDLFEHAAQVYVEAIELDLQGAQQNLENLQSMGVETWFKTQEAKMI